MGLFGSIVGGIIGGMVGGPLGAIVGAGIGGAATSDHSSSGYNPDILQGNCPNCNAPISMYASQTGVKCNSCGNVFFLATCPSCHDKSLVPGPGRYKCQCGKSYTLTFCPDCVKTFINPTGRFCPYCSKPLIRTMFQSEDDRLVFIVSAEIALSVIVAKADGHFDSVERQAIIDRYVKFGMNQKGLKYIRQMIDETERTGMTLEVVCDDLLDVLEPAEIRDVINYLFSVAIADGEIHENEISLLWRMASRLGVSQSEFQRMQDAARTLLEGKIGGVARLYALLGVDQNATDETVKEAYRRMAMKYHPDRGVRTGLSADVATAKFMEIQDAYEKIMEERKSA